MLGFRLAFFRARRNLRLSRPGHNRGRVRFRAQAQGLQSPAHIGALAAALGRLKAMTLTTPSTDECRRLAHLGLDRPAGLGEQVMRRLVCLALRTGPLVARYVVDGKMRAPLTSARPPSSSRVGSRVLFQPI